MGAKKRGLAWLPFETDTFCNPLTLEGPGWLVGCMGFKKKLELFLHDKGYPPGN